MFPVVQPHPHPHRRTIIIPPTTDMALIFPLDHENKKFDKGFYSPALTDGRATKEQVENFLKEAEKAFKDKLKWLKALKVYLVFCFLMGILVMTLFSITVISDLDDDLSGSSYYQTQSTSHSTHGTHSSTHNSNNLRHTKRHHQIDPEEQLDVMVFGWIGLMIAAVVWSLIFRGVKKYLFKKGKKAVQAVVEKNYLAFANNGLRWNLPLDFPHYIELWKDYKGQAYTPQVQNNQLNGLYTMANNQVHVPVPGSVQIPVQKYPTLNNQVVDRAGYNDYQNDPVVRPLLGNQVQRQQENATYVPPYVNFGIPPQ